ncbi:hypothetical protein [Pandoraea anhela]|uniref:Uncharacterized protein n=1 Tax=Pandoraea anhela TaxID=2508295 RepID=A0A5E4RGA3_9BURK|nr:hypothetical protein [Pandoraea anhela]VVD61049.1 hypothetical protein PAN31108_00113 [Pandoraea anhela]
MRRRWFPLWLVVCVLVTQVALARHIVFHTVAALAAASAQSGGLGGLGGSPRQSVAADKSGQSAADEEGLFEQCLAFIAVDVALPGLPVFASLPSARGWHYPPSATLRVRSALRGPTHNRDPPFASVPLV